MIPNMSADVKRLYDTGLFNLKTHEGQGAFVDACVSMLHGIDPNWGHLIKKPAQTDVHDHGEDSALYKLPNNTAQAVDFIGGAGGTNPQPGWIVDPLVQYTHADWFNPTDHGIVEVPVADPGQPYPDERTWWPQVFDGEVALRYGRAGKAYPDGPSAFRWASRTAYDIRGGLTKEASLAKHLEELERELGLR